MASTTKYIYSFGNGKAEGQGDQRVLLGGKGAGLAEMTHIGLPVPAGFTITTQASAAFYQRDKRWPAELETQIHGGLDKLERTCQRALGDPDDPLLVSVRSGAAVSMPGMMETILNLGLNDQSVEGLAAVTGNRRFALDAYRRLIMMYGTTAAGIDRSRFDETFDRLKELHTRPRLGIPKHRRVHDADIDQDELTSLVKDFKAIYQESTGQPFPQDPHEQLRGAIDAVFESWMAEKAVIYRRLEKITGIEGTAVNVCQMVFGNLGDDCGTGVCFTRDPSTGENVFYGDLLINAQGEDVVAGIRTPNKIAELANIMPDVWDHLLAVRAILELHHKDMQDLEFTVERGQLYMLQCRTGKRSPGAAFRIAAEQATQPLMDEREAKRLADSGHLPKKYAALATKPVITKEDAILRITAEDLLRLRRPVIDPQISVMELEGRRIGTGIGAVPGAACGVVALTPAEAERLAAEGKDALLVRKETSPEDVGGMHAAAGILTATGGKTSHAAVVARGWGKCCIVGCEALRIDDQARTMSLDGRTLREGEVLTLDGSSGSIYDGQLELTSPSASAECDTILGWADEIRRLEVRTNADTAEDAQIALEMGAEGIGLCRTEHMFFGTVERRLAMQQMIVAHTSQARRLALDKLQPFQKEDFLELFKVMDGKPVTIRLIDPPLHEFLPKTPEDIQQLSDYAGVSVEDITRRADQLHESNPMLGHRGCRLCITYPEILETQTSAIMEAAVEAANQGVKVVPEIMIPLAIDAKELTILTEQIHAVADAILDNAGIRINYSVGTMIETPRAALLADRIAKTVDFVSFGTNDLTQTVMVLSRDDAGRFLPAYIDQEKYAIFPDHPFQSLDQEGVGLLVEWALNGARSVDPKFKIGICGEHGGDTKSIAFFNRIGLDYVSCSPFRVPIARLAAAQAVIQQKRERTAKPAAKPQKPATAKPKKKAATKLKKVAAKKKKVAPKTKKRAVAKTKKKTRPKTKAKPARKAKPVGKAKSVGKAKPGARTKRPAKAKKKRTAKGRTTGKRASKTARKAKPTPKRTGRSKAKAKARKKTR